MAGGVGGVYLGGVRESPHGDPLTSSAVNGTLWRAASCAELRASVSVPVVARRLRLPEVAVAAAAEHWVARRRQRSYRHLLPRFREVRVRVRVCLCACAWVRVRSDVILVDHFCVTLRNVLLEALLLCSVLDFSVVGGAAIPLCLMPSTMCGWCPYIYIY